MPKLKLTSRFVETIKVEVRTDYWDEICRGLVLRVAPTGVRSWTCIYTPSEGSKQRVTIGKFPAISLEAARGKALKIMSQVAEGENPAATKRLRREAMTVFELGSEYVERYAKANKRTWAEDERMLKVDVLPLIGNRKAAGITKRDILDVIDLKADSGKIAQARLIFALLRKMFGWAQERDIISLSPLLGLKAPGKPQSRDRVLTDKELSTLWNALPEAAITRQMRDIIQLLMLTGQRAGEVSGILYGELELDRSVWVLPAERSKNGRTHQIPLTSLALEILQNAVNALDEPEASTPVFSRTGEAIESNAVSKAARLKLQTLTKPWTPHDLRRTVATGLAGLGENPHVIEALLNHVSGFRSGVAGVYNRFAYAEEKRRALVIWENHILALVDEKENVVIPLKNRVSQ